MITTPAPAANPPPRLENALFVPELSTFGFDILGPANGRICVETSTDLNRWTALQTNLPSSPVFQFIDSATWVPRRFYRVRVQD